MDIPPSSLCPGYKQVDAFGPDECYEDEEVCYVTLDLGSIEPTLLPSTSTYRLIGLDTPTPFMQLSGTILKGQHRSLLGTELLFTEQKDDNDRTKRYMAPIGTTEQRIRFNEVRLQAKDASPPPVAKGKRKAKEKGGVDAEALSVIQDVDRMTGVSRAGRSRESKKIKGKRKKKVKKSEALEASPAILDAIMDDGEDRSDGVEPQELTVMDIAED